MILLTHNSIQTRRSGINESELLVKVKFNEETRTVESIVSVQAYNWIKNVTTDLTHIFNDQHNSALEEMVENINWDEVYASYLESKPSLFNEAI